MQIISQLEQGVQSQIDNLENKILKEKSYSDLDCPIIGILTKQGNINTSYGDTYITSDYISIEGYRSINFKNLFPEASGDNEPVGLVIYDTNKEVTRAIGDSTGSITIEPGESYIRFTPLNKTLNNAEVLIKTEPIPEPIEPIHYLDALPSIIYVTPFKEYNIYMDNVIIGYSEKGMLLNVSGNINSIEARNRCIRLNIRNNVGTYSTTWDLYDADGNLLESKTVQIVVSSSTAGTGNKQFLFIGDSTIDNAIAQAHQGPEIVKEFHTLCINNLGFAPYLLGKRSYPEEESGGYRHEGHAGMTSSYFIGSNSPFYYNGSINFQAYINDVYTLTPGATNTLDYVVYQIGINDLKTGGNPLTVIANIKTLINAILNSFPSCKIIIGIPPTGNDADGFSSSFNGYITTLTEFIPFRKRMLEYVELIVKEFSDNQYKENVFICNAGQMIDRIYGFPWEMQVVSSRVSQTVLTHIDAVHPNTDGYDQMADAYFARIKNLV